jgi:hypothetical protein
MQTAAILLRNTRALPIDKATLDTMLAKGEVELIPGSRAAYRMKPIVLEDDYEDFTIKPAATYETKVTVAASGRSARSYRK